MVPLPPDPKDVLCFVVEGWLANGSVAGPLSPLLARLPKPVEGPLAETPEKPCAGDFPPPKLESLGAAADRAVGWETGWVTGGTERRVTC